MRFTLLFLLVVAVVAASGWYGLFHWQGTLAVSGSLPQRPSHIVGPRVQPEQWRPAPTPAPAPPASDTRLWAFEGFALADQSPLSAWAVQAGEAGSLDHISLAGVDPSALGLRPIREADILAVTGWAGDPRTGVRYPWVVFSLCGAVVGAVRVEEPRPAITRLVHGNLRTPGFSAHLPVALLPRCSDNGLSTLSAYALLEENHLVPLAGRVPLLLPPSPAMIPGEGSATVLTPHTLPPLARETLTLAAPGGRLRACPSQECELVGGLEAGTHSVVLLDRATGWRLIKTPTQTGWIAESVLR